jgi:chromosome segregation ATPase
MMNNAQIVSNCRALESKVTEQAAKIDEQAATIDELKKDLTGLQDVVQHLVRGLYCQETQTQCISSHLSSIKRHPYRRSRFENPDTHQWDSWPTTRQGDDCERRIEALERQFKELVEFNPSLLESENQLKQPEEEAEPQFVPITLRKVLDYDELFEVEDSDSDLSSLTEK